MNIREQLQNVYNGNGKIIAIREDMTDNITVEDVCIIIHAIKYKQCNLVLSTGITNFVTRLYRDWSAIEKDFKNIEIVAMLNIILSSEWVDMPFTEIRYNGEKIVYNIQDFIETAKKFGVVDQPAAFKIISILGINTDYGEEIKNNIMDYLGLHQNTKSSRNM
jgi:hypothetical protein